ncbi:MAG: hypothetical protein K8F92_16975 [Hyphomicrobium sp.]|uniref:hypothetical protein n=1 Tax=Hyphomicrobium sp. TaxID=82 RepID=UPI00132B2C0A|nr:hypothetical protein [Hyphomicrobium sp.]KAB2941528.1 MAG: hypothetical protein F9K20_09020 [Hyphomicrobium sp.]MBZ0211321.1 hypothetical protein [Hyphomicrobium sp.]
MKYKVDPNKFATVLTSCGRFDLLGETVSSLQRYFDVERVLIAEDSEDSAGAAQFARAFPVADVRVNLPKLGQMRSIDAHYATLATPYVLHLEDDWGFTRSLDLDRVTDLLEARPDISVVCIAHRVYDPRFQKGAKAERHGDIDYLVWETDAHPKWFSYSFNPSIARLALWREVGPFAKFVTEENLSQFLKGRGMRIAMVVPGIADHIGDDRHAHDPFQPKRAKTFLQRLKRSIAKRLPLLSGERRG